MFDLTVPWRDKLLSFLHELRELTLSKNGKVSVDFRKTAKMFPQGTLLFAAELARIRGARKERCVRCTLPSDQIVAQVLKKLGLFKLMGRRSSISISSDSVKYWSFESNTVVDASQTEPIIAAYAECFSDVESRKMYAALTEAMTNCVQHAYIGARRDGVSRPPEKRWWMLSQMKDGVLFVAVCDLGIGINRSLTEGRRWVLDGALDKLKAVGRWPHSRFIKAAMELDKSRIDEKHRGNGLKQLKDAIVAFPTGELCIDSNAGRYAYASAKSEEQMSDFKSSILGTVICWRIPLPVEVSQ